ncbi:acyl-CoA carboxylase epsilon subunit, partial [Streptomyces sp. NPDC059552]|uniref:acyl-CoA carboxylase epsilon subunit n=1 Tax=Streptomyces sp. NPDC059552 TaxID=3346862 RepID=UPI003687B7B6
MRIVRGAPDGAELAAVLLALLTATGHMEGAEEETAPPARAAWGPAHGGRPPGAGATRPPTPTARPRRATRTGGRGARPPPRRGGAPERPG